MTLTRRLYELDEVVAAFMVSLKKKLLEESLFWLEELEISAEDDLASKAIFDLWFLRVGLLNWSFWLSWKTHKDSPEGRYALVVSWCKVTGLDSTLWRSYCLAFASNEAWDTSLYRKPALEWWAASSYKREECAELWFKMKGGGAKPLPIDIGTNIYNYDITNIRESRKYSVPVDAHLGNTRRGLKWLSTAVLYDMSLYSLLSSPIWAGLLEPYVDEDNEWLDDTKKEEFYDKYFFSGDVPDEWSIADREKSHGRPPSRRESCPLMQWWVSWVPENHKYIYGKADTILMKWVRSMKVENVFSDLDAIIVEKSERKYDLCNDKLIVYKV
jgi:hypothetical protein